MDPLVEILGDWAAKINAASVFLRVGLAFAFAAAIGCERANKRHSAGLRTFILVSLTSVVAMLIDVYAAAALRATVPLVSAATVVGIAIISSNSILYSSKNQIKGLTTAVALWASSLMSLAVGCGFYSASLICFTALIVCLSVLSSFEKFLKDRSNHFEVHLELTAKDTLQDFVSTIRALGIRIDDIEANPAYLGSGLSVFSVSFTITSPELKQYKKHAEIIEALQSLEYVHYIEEMN